MDDPVTSEQLHLWNKLNRLYGEDSTGPGEPEEIHGGQTGAGPGAPVAGAQPVRPEAPPVGGPVQGKAGEICTECDQNCKQTGDKFLLALCPKTGGKKAPSLHGTAYMVRSSLGYDKVNETCRICRKSCKQFTQKLYRMLCLGFEPLEPGGGKLGS